MHGEAEEDRYKASPSLRRRLSLRCAKSFLWIPLGGIALILGVWVHVVIHLRDEEAGSRNAAIRATSELVLAFSAHVNKTVHDADVVVRFVKYEYERSPSTFNLKELQSQGLVTADTALQVTIVDKDGKPTQSTATELHPLNLADRQHFAAHKVNPKLGLYISEPLEGRLSHHRTIQFTRRLDRPDGSFDGVVVVSEDPDFLTTGLSTPEGFGTGKMVAVLSDNGTLLSRLADKERASSTTPVAFEYRSIVGTKDGIYVDPVDNLRRFMAYRHLSNYPVVVLVGLSEKDALAAYRHDKALYLIMAATLTAILGLAIVATMWTMTRLARARSAMQFRAETDSLTELPNRYLLVKILRERITLENSSGNLALLFVDLDNFKQINDAMGHQTGDELLKNVARRLAKVAGEDILLARVGGDEFVFMVEGPAPLDRARLLAASIISAFEIAFGLRGNSYVIRLSIGIAPYRGGADQEYDLLRQADLAMYATKTEGKLSNASSFKIYSAEMSTRAMRDIERQQELQYAILNREFFLEYQPIVSLATGDVHGLEAKIRWSHPDKGVIPPVDFIPFAEHTGFIVPIGEIVLEQASAQMHEWRKIGKRSLFLSINISASQLVHGDVTGTVRRCVSEYAIDPGKLRLEITEASILDSTWTISQQLRELREIGVKVILDDFGIGYAPLSQLTSLNVDGIKIDRSFTAGIPNDSRSIAMFKMAASLSRDLGLLVIADGVITAQQANWLRELGIFEAQGPYFSEPLSPDSLPANHVA
jgi:diguanylate cyclase (GGDEF)-like protein